MKTKFTNLLGSTLGLALGIMLAAGVASAQTTTASNNGSAKSSNPKKSEEVTEVKKASPKADTIPTSQTVGDDAGNFTVTSSIEFGYRGQRVDGDVNKFKSDLNYKAGPRLFDSTFLMKAKNGGKGEAFDTLLVTSTGWGADPYGNMRISAEKPEWYRFEGTYRRFKYYRYLNNIVNPNWNFSPTPRRADPVTGLHGYDVYTKMGDFDLTILPKNETIRFNVGYSPERYRGPVFTNYHSFGNEFWLLSNMKSKADDFRIGADGKLGPIDWTFLQGFRRFEDDSAVNNQAIGLNRNPSTSTTFIAQLSSFFRQEPTHGNVNFTRFSMHSLVANKLDITGRIIYSKATSNYVFTDNFSGTNINLRISNPTWPPSPPSATPNTTNPSYFSVNGNVERPNTVGDIGVTYLATDKFRVSDTFRVEDFDIDGTGIANHFYSQTRPITGGTRTDNSPFSGTGFSTVKYRKYLNTIEGDYQFNPRYAVHFGYRYGNRHEEQQRTGADLGSLGARALAAADTELDSEENHTHAFFGGLRARPAKNFTLYFDAEHGSADNVFTRIGNYDYTNVRAKSRWAPNRKLIFNLAFILRDNSNPADIQGVSLANFGVDVKTRIFTSSVDWMPNPNVTINAGYNFNWLNTDAVVDYSYGVPPATNVRYTGATALYFQRLNYFFLDLTARLNRRMTLYTSYRINQDNGQGDRVATPGGTNPTLITSYPMNFQSPEARLAIKLNRRLDWNLGYQYYAYNESDLLTVFPPSVRPQNYHAHLPYMSLRLYFGRKE